MIDPNEIVVCYFNAYFTVDPQNLLSTLGAIQNLAMTYYTENVSSTGVCKIDDDCIVWLVRLTSPANNVLNIENTYINIVNRIISDLSRRDDFPGRKDLRLDLPEIKCSQNWKSKSTNSPYYQERYLEIEMLKLKI